MAHTRDRIVQFLLAEAAKSNSDKRKVGCIIMDDDNLVLGYGHNIEYSAGTAHAETEAIKMLTERYPLGNRSTLTLYVSHPPCPECSKAILAAGITRVEVIEEFIKFDGDKVRYDLVPVEALNEVAVILTQGARKYKPNNWRECQDPDRYIAAAMRHFELYRAGHWADEESGRPHLAHVICNLMFLLVLKHIPKPLLNIVAIVDPVVQDQ